VHVGVPGGDAVRRRECTESVRGRLRGKGVRGIARRDERRRGGHDHESTEYAEEATHEELFRRA